MLLYTQKKDIHFEQHWEDYAKYYDIIDNSYPWVPEYIPKMKALNPNLKVIHYSSMIGIYGYPDYSYCSSRGWLLKDSSGQIYQEPNWGAYLLDIGNPEASHWLGQRLKGYIDEGYDGIFLDNTNPWSFYPVNIINPRTGQPYWHYVKGPSSGPVSSDVFVNDMVSHLKILKSYLPNSLIIGNCINGATKYDFGYWDFQVETDKIMKELDGAMNEYFVASSSDDLYSEEDWKADVDLLSRIPETKPNFIYVPTDRVGPWAGGGSDSQQGWYTFASFLLGVKYPEQTYLWAHNIEPATQSWAREIVSVDTGYPLGNYYKRSDGVYVREFSKVTVFVNPSSETRGGMSSHSGAVELQQPETLKLTVSSNPSGVPFSIRRL